MEVLLGALIFRAAILGRAKWNDKFRVAFLCFEIDFRINGDHM